MAVSLSAPVLVVDDYNTMLRIVRNLLRQLGFSNIDEASDARTALTKMKSKDYALVISDWHMVPMTGEQLLRCARAEARSSRTPFLMVANEAADAAVAEQAGVATYIVKPFNAQALKSRIECVMGAF